MGVEGEVSVAKIQDHMVSDSGGEVEHLRAGGHSRCVLRNPVEHRRDHPVSYGDHFLSMRPFKCLEGKAKYWCRVPYPYENRHVVSAGDLTDLEYDLLFLWKGATEYGINMWNGVYYRLEIEGTRLVGRLHEVDMDPLGVPPEAGNLRPIVAKDLHEADPDGHWLPVLVIE